MTERVFTPNEEDLKIARNIFNAWKKVRDPERGLAHAFCTYRTLNQEDAVKLEKMKTIILLRQLMMGHDEISGVAIITAKTMENFIKILENQ